MIEVALLCQLSVITINLLIPINYFCYNNFLDLEQSNECIEF